MTFKTQNQNNVQAPSWHNLHLPCWLSLVDGSGALNLCGYFINIIFLDWQKVPA